MKQSIPVGVIIGAVVAVLLLVGFFVFKMVAGDDGHGAVDPKLAQQHMQRSAAGYGQPPAGMQRPTGPGPGQPGYGGGRPMGYGGQQGQGGYGRR
jgi:hypothetical protein